MRALSAAFAFAVAVAAFSFMAPSPAEAGPTWKATLASTDAGSSQTVALQKKACYCVQATWSQTCMKLGNQDGGSLAAGLFGADCSKEFMIPQMTVNSTVVQKPTYCFDSAYRDALVVANVDAGAATTQLFFIESTSGGPCNSSGF